MKIKTGALVRTMKDHTSYKVEQQALQVTIEEVRQAQAALPDEEKDPGAVNRVEAQLAETVAVMPSIESKIETWVGDLEGIMATIEDSCATNMEAVRETEDWQKAEAAIAQARTFASE